MKKITFLLIALAIQHLTLSAQKNYQVSIDLTKAENDRLTVNIVAPKITESDAIFIIPKIVPGTYAISNFGKFVSNLVATDKKGNHLTVEHSDDNTWKIADAKKLYKISYEVDDTWDTKQIKQYIFEPSGTDIEKDSVFVVNTFGFIGYLKGRENLPFKVSITKPKGFYGSTSLIAEKSKKKEVDVYKTNNYHALADAPMMYCLPDTSWIKVANADVLISVYSPNKRASATSLVNDIRPILEAHKNYLGGTLPVNKYAFIIYLTNKFEDLKGYGALEHRQSCFILLPGEFTQEFLSEQLKDIASHEFLHIVTPLGIHSEEIGNFDYIEPKMSKHLWLYEGLTEYGAHHSQLKSSVIDLNVFSERIKTKIQTSQKQFKDTLPFTELSEQTLDKYKSQYMNVYQKGALIGLCLDVKLRQLSSGTYGTQQMLQDLGKLYGESRSFKDDELFDKIASISYPEIRTFFSKYVEGNQPLPLDEIFNLLGLEYKPDFQQTELETRLRIEFPFDSLKNSYVLEEENQSAMTKLGKRLSFKKGDILVSINGNKFTKENLIELFSAFRTNAKKADTLTFVVKRKISNEEKELTLKTDIREETKKFILLKQMDNASAAQLKLREAWMGRK